MIRIRGRSKRGSSRDRNILRRMTRMSRGRSRGRKISTMCAADDFSARECLLEISPVVIF